MAIFSTMSIVEARCWGIWCCRKKTKAGDLMMRFLLEQLMFVVVVSLIFQFLGKYMYNYKIENKQILFCVFGAFVFYRINIEEVTEIKIVSFSEIFSFKNFFLGPIALFFFNRFVGQYVSIKKNGKGTKLFYITPDDATEFVNKVRKMIKS